MRRVTIIGSMTVALSILACAKADEISTRPPANRKPVVYAANYPLAYFAERIGAAFVEVEFAAPPGEDPAMWTPDAETINAFQAADLILLNGATYSKWTGYASLPLTKVVDTSRAFADRYLTVAGVGTHTHGPGGEHSHTGTAFTTWIDLQQAALQAQAVRDALVEVMPEKHDELWTNSDLLVRDLIALDEEIGETMFGFADVPLLASHPVYDYFSRRYRLDVVSMMWEPDAFPDERAWRDLRHERAHHRAEWMIWESQPLPESVARLREQGIESVIFDPCGNRPTDGDFLTVMQANVNGLRRSFSDR